MKYLNDNNIQCGIHYPIPIHKMPFYVKGQEHRSWKNGKLCRGNCESSNKPFLTHRRK